MAEPAEIVKGCMVIKANGYAVWELLQRELDDRFKATGHKNVYFPLLIPNTWKASRRNWPWSRSPAARNWKSRT